MHDEERDYIWHFRLSEEREGSPPAPEDSLAGMVREQIEALLRCVAFTHKGVDVTVTGFRFLGRGEREHTLRSSLMTGRPDGPGASGEDGPGVTGDAGGSGRPRDGLDDNHR